METENILKKLYDGQENDITNIINCIKKIYQLPKHNIEISDKDLSLSNITGLTFELRNLIYISEQLLKQLKKNGINREISYKLEQSYRSNKSKDYSKLRPKYDVIIELDNKPIIAIECKNSGIHSYKESEKYKKYKKILKDNGINYYLWVNKRERKGKLQEIIEKVFSKENVFLLHEGSSDQPYDKLIHFENVFKRFIDRIIKIIKFDVENLLQK